MQDPVERAQNRGVGLALAGGGPVGAVYEVGALRALEEALEGLKLDRLDVYVGVSAGALVAACLANGMTAGQLYRATAVSDADRLPFRARTFFTPAVGNWLRRSLAVPGLFYDTVRDYARNPADQAPFDALLRMTRALPIGLFDNEPIRDYLSGLFADEERSDDFRRLRARLVVVATDLDSGQAVRFGEPGRDHIPISRAVQASTALPGLYPPVEIEGRDYVDGVLLKTLHASVALEAGCKLVFCINPLVPVDTAEAVAAGVMHRGRLIDRGLPTVLSQTFRTLVHSRLAAGMKYYEQRYPDRTLLLFEPGREDYRMFFTNIFKLSNRRAVCEHAYRSTRKQLRERREELRPVLAAHGIRIRDEILDAPDECPAVEQQATGETPVAEGLARALTRLENLL